MITGIIVLILLSVIIGALNASEDKINFHWHKSAFKKIDEFWKVKFNSKFYFRHFFSEDSWRNKYNQRHYENGIRRVFTIKIHPAFTDWFHFSKSLRLIFECSQLIIFGFVAITFQTLTSVILFPIGLHIIRNLSFNLFFNKILNGRKQKNTSK
jgi:hypothetical protein